MLRRAAREKRAYRQLPSLCLVLIDIVVRVAHALNFFSVLVGNLDAEFFFETHYQLNRVERVSAEVVDKPRVGSNFVFVNTQLVNDDLFYFLLNLWIGHYFCSSFNCPTNFSLPSRSVLLFSVHLRQTEICPTDPQAT